jgi:hypothetical protein
MFSEDLYKVACEAQLTDDKSIMKTLNEMVKECFKYLDEHRSDNLNEVYSNFLFVDNVWQMVTKRLIKEDRGIAREDGWQQLIASKEEFSFIALQHGWKLKK